MRDSVNFPVLHEQLFLLQPVLPQIWVHVFNPRCTERPTRMTLTALDVQFATVEISFQGRVLASHLGARAMMGVMAICHDSDE